MPRPVFPHGRFPVATAGLMLVAIVLCLSLAGNASAGPSLQPDAPLSPNGLVINEVFDSQTPGNEFFELYNTSAVAINLSTYVIYNRDGSTPLSNLADPNIAPG